ncbi:hypothetical protein [Dickeya dadantii]|nr:hypothetical protein [Dickeya dadantii]
MTTLEKLIFATSGPKSIAPAAESAANAGVAIIAEITVDKKYF